MDTRAAGARPGGARRNRVAIAADATLHSLMLSVSGTPALPVSR
ncbi:hypothetical protein GCM10010423_46680 [Streptomyces levis]|uniref:Uncharacterized protein n=1 Tax=Streptomyces levis TaxID=285566 RepID=A0ABN3NW91_9ACTN